MDRIEKKDSLCYQILFNKPLCMSESKYIYGFRIKDDELKHKPFSEERLLEYVVEEIFGKCLFEAIHHGSFEGDLDEIWIDRKGNEYKGCGAQTRLYSYDATVENMMNYRCDLVYANCENKDVENYWIIDAADYFECRAKMDAEDHKQVKNQWMENYLRIQFQRNMLSLVTGDKSKNLNYEIQELIKEEWFG